MQVQTDYPEYKVAQGFVPNLARLLSQQKKAVYSDREGMLLAEQPLPEPIDSLCVLMKQPVYPVKMGFFQPHIHPVPIETTYGYVAILSMDQDVSGEPPSVVLGRKSEPTEQVNIPLLYNSCVVFRSDMWGYVYTNTDDPKLVIVFFN